MTSDEAIRVSSWINVTEMGIHFLIKNVTEEGIRFLSINVTQMRFIDSWENVTIDFLSLCSSSEAESMASESQPDQALTP